MKILELNLKKKWFDLVFDGLKKEEYRSLSNYWVSRLMKYELRGHNGAKTTDSEMESSLTHNLDILQITEKDFRHFDYIHFKNGWKRKDGTPAPNFYIELKGIRIDEGVFFWGAVPGKKYFVLLVITKT